MPDMIKDGTGHGYLAKVDADNLLHTRSVQEGEALHSNLEGNAYNLNTGVITLTDAAETPVIYFKNNAEDRFIIESVVLGVWGSDGDGLDMLATFIRNPTTGTIISSPTDVPINSNRNYGSTNSLNADVYVGGTGATLTDGDDHILVRITEESRGFIGINEVLPKGTSFGVKLTPPTGNTSMNCYVAVIGYLHD